MPAVHPSFQQLQFDFCHSTPPPIPTDLIFEALPRPLGKKNNLQGEDERLTSIASRLMEHLNLPQLAQRTRVSWNPRMRSSAGRATWPQAVVELNPRLTTIAEEEVTRTLLHELAHLVAYERSGRRRIEAHGREWQQACADLGIPGEKATHSLPLPTRKIARRWRYHCLTCEKNIDRVRRFKSHVACHSCCQKHNGGKYHQHFQLVEQKLTVA